MKRTIAFFAKLKSKYEKIWSVAFLLTRAYLKRANKWTTALIVGIMTLTFLNVTVLSGILVGLIQGSIDAQAREYTGDVFISTKDGEKNIEKTYHIEKVLETVPSISAFTTRTLSAGVAVANYQIQTDDEAENAVSTFVAGIIPSKEDAVTGLSDKILDGEYLNDDDEGYVLVGKDILAQYTAFAEYDPLRDVYPGTKIKVQIGDIEKEVTVKGVIGSKVGDISLRVMFVKSELDRLLGRTDGSANEIAILANSNTTPESLKASLVAEGVDKYADVKTKTEAISRFLLQISATFGMLGTLFGSVGLLVALITVFIVVFINAITRRKSIGILKGIGVPSLSIEISYVLQAVVYAILGGLIGSIILYGLLVPSIAENPINFPFSDGILVAPIGATFFRFMILVVFTAFAGFIPARMVVKKNTLDSILGR